MRRHWITTSLAWLCFATAAAELYSLFAFSTPATPGDASLNRLLWRLLGLFPTSTVILWPVNLIVGVVSPGLSSSKAYSGISSAVTLVVSVILGIAILRMRSWAHAGLITICALTAAAQLHTLFWLVHYSPGLLTVLQSNFRGASAGYVSGAGPGSILASFATAIALLWLLIRNGLPALDSAKAKLDTSLDTAQGGRAHQFLLYATAAALFGQFLLLISGPWNEPGLNRTRLLLCILVAPNLFILIRSWRGPGRISLGLAAGYGLLIGYIGALFLPAFLFGLAWIAASPRSQGELDYLWLEFIPALQLAAAICAVIVTRSLPPLPKKSVKTGLWGTAFVLPLVVGTAFPQFYFDWQRGNLPVPGLKSYGDEYHELVRRDNAARALVPKYGYCAFLYAKLHPDSGFPESASLLGPDGSGCLNREEAEGHPEGYSLHYSAHKSESSARFDRFTVATQLNHQRQINGTLMDEKGILVAVSSQEIHSQLITADQLSWDTSGENKGSLNSTISWTLPKIVTCAKTLRDQSSTGEFPATLGEVLRAKLKPADHSCINVYVGHDPFVQAAENSNRATENGWVLEYDPQRDASAKIAHIVITLRPEQYATQGVRSYLIDDSGSEHATSEDRSATVEDPAPLKCETGGSCNDE